MTDTRIFPPLRDDLDHRDTFVVVSLSLNMLQMLTVVDMKPASPLTRVEPVEYHSSTVTLGSNDGNLNVVSE